MGSCGTLWEEKAWWRRGVGILVGDLWDIDLKTMSWWVLVWGRSICGKSVENFGNGQGFARGKGCGELLEVI